ncbi:hypothetical protein PK69_15165 [Xanthomonas phaseoli pv. phaseoli]|uniref:Uncharacterized protein n=1 Tax=Xanthomonas campestris pv. phaseoli TaxID=317013 RepID=A0AB34QJC2_XANCH|nr:hypothetical protein AC609_18170 [Xanthomonas phaseoli pv. phaseoli]AZU32550.1 hypothetical protein AC801_23190 [Xanthomonas sp. ISO98C4]AZU27332.1 hypothetical protein AC611_18190 [Xanthomonas phaseoli pv. phaseoli]AZU36097.1 hypothetical protein AC610_18160 [Xanthomonas phaseoli pv. phaseoli]KGT48986.1 hypothetical protein NZ02_22130 [Xanthomonas phaseoli pv. phaseoli]
MTTLRSIAQAQHHLDATLLMRMGQRRHRPIRRPFRCDLTKPLGRARRARWASVIPNVPCAGASCSRSAQASNRRPSAPASRAATACRSNANRHASSKMRGCAQENPSKNNSIAITKASSRPVWDG